MASYIDSGMGRDQRLFIRIIHLSQVQSGVCLDCAESTKLIRYGLGSCILSFSAGCPFGLPQGHIASFLLQGL